MENGLEGGKTRSGEAHWEGGLLLESWRCDGGYEYDEEDRSGEIYFIDGIAKARW